jgi:hypothetical protein
VPIDPVVLNSLAVALDHDLRCVTSRFSPVSIAATDHEVSLIAGAWTRRVEDREPDVGDVVAYLCAELVDQIQPYSSGPFPGCPWHLGRHPLRLGVDLDLDSAGWTCPEGGGSFAVGSLPEVT